MNEEQQTSMHTNDVANNIADMQGHREDNRIHKTIRTIMILVSVATISVLLLASASFVVMPKNNQAAFGMKHQEAHGIMGEPSNSIDVVFIGDSETTSSISPLQMWKEQGFTSYVCATNGQNLPYSLTLLNRVLANQSPKVIAIEANSLYAPFSITDSATRMLQDIFPVFEYHDRWKTLSINDFTTMPKTTWSDPLKGFYINEAVLPADAFSHMAPSDACEDLPALNEYYLAKFVDRCRKAGATPVIIATPSTVCWSTARHNGMSNAASRLKVDFIDLNVAPSQINIDWNTDTRDAGDHLNYKGASKVSQGLGTILKQRFGFDQSTDGPAAKRWDEAWRCYVQMIPKEDSS